MENNLTKRFVSQQVLYECCSSGALNFASSVLFSRGFNAAQVGILMFLGQLLSCLIQPFLGSIADRSERPILPAMMCMLSGTAFACLGVLFFFNPEKPVYAVLYLVSMLAVIMMLPMHNAVSVYYNERGYYIDYGMGRGLGALAFAFASLIVGVIMDHFGSRFVILFMLIVTLVYFFLARGYPEPENHQSVKKSIRQTSSLPVFFGRYKWYCVSLFGISCLGLVHSMTENYMIKLIEPMGGSNSNLGVALFIATATACPVMILFRKIQPRLGTRRILRIAGIAYTFKCVFFLLARSVRAVYAIELMQCVTFNFLSPIQMYYARESTDEADMVKGQTVCTSGEALGSAFGNLLGGAIIAASDVRTMLAAAVAIAAAGTLLLFVTVPRALRAGECHKE